MTTLFKIVDHCPSHTSTPYSSPILHTLVLLLSIELNHVLTQCMVYSVIMFIYLSPLTRI